MQHVNHTFDVMTAATQYQVACEFDYPEKLIKELLEKKQYKTAGDLIEDLEDYLLKNEEEVEEKPASGEEKIEIVAAVESTTNSSSSTPQELTLLEETVFLYKKSYCSVCRINKRCFVTLPCSHLSLCNTCLTSTHKCPFRDCQMEIEYAIPIYIC